MQKIVEDWQQDLGMVVSKIKIKRSRVAIDPGFKLLLWTKLASPSSPEIATFAAADKHGVYRDIVIFDGILALPHITYSSYVYRSCYVL
jgi:hypothetical protein